MFSASRRSRHNHLQEEPLRTTAGSLLELLTFSTVENQYGPRPFVLPALPGENIFLRLVLTSLPGRRFATTTDIHAFGRKYHNTYQRSCPGTGRKHQPGQTNGCTHQTATLNGNAPNNTSRKPARCPRPPPDFDPDTGSLSDPTTTPVCLRVRPGSGAGRVASFRTRRMNVSNGF